MPEKEFTRRNFITQSVTLLVSVSSFSLLTHSCSRESTRPKTSTKLSIRKGKIHLDINTTTYKNLKRVGHGVKIELSSDIKPVIVTRVSETEVAAFSSECTHAGYEVSLPFNGVLTCESGHGGSYDLRGNVLTPPPKSNLNKYNTVLNDDTVIIDLQNYV